MVKINYLSSKDYQKMLLQKGNHIFSSDGSDFYQVGLNSILKDYQYDKLPIDKEFLSQVLENWKEILIEQSKITGFEELLKSEELWLVNGYLKGITMPMIPSHIIDFEDYIYSCNNNMKFICEQFASLNSLFEKGSRLDLVFLDSTTKGNLKIDPHTSSILFCDGEGIQTKRIFPFMATDFLNLDVNKKIMKKYLTGGNGTIYATSNTNRLILLAYFIKLCTRYVWITDNYPGFQPNVALDLVLQEIGLSQDEFIAPAIRKMYRKGDIPKISDDSWHEFGKAYTLVPKGYGLEQTGGYAFKRR